MIDPLQARRLRPGSREETGVTDGAAEPSRQFRAGRRVPRTTRAVADDIAEQIRSGRLAAGYRLPPYLALAEAYHVSLSTVQRAIALLQARGLVRGRRGNGVYVTDDAQP
jgi:DNA-binding FadR family transcriptional regulator